MNLGFTNVTGQRPKPSKGKAHKWVCPYCLQRFHAGQAVAHKRTFRRVTTTGPLTCDVQPVVNK